MGYYADSRSNSIDCRNWRTLISIARSPRLTAILWRLRFVDSSCRSISNSFVLTDSEVFQKTYMTQPPAAGTICWDEFLQLTIVLSVCIGFIQTGAFFVSREQSRTWAEIPRHAQGKVRLLPVFEKGGAASPPSHTLPPGYTYLLGRRYKCLQATYSHSPASKANINAEMGVIVFPSR